MTASTTAIFVTYNSERRIGAALEGMRAAHEAGVAECVVVDNASRDGTVAVVERDHPWAKLVHGGGNLGYGRGLNLGMRHASTPYVLFMNPDAVLGAEALAKLVSFMEDHPRAGMAAPAIIEAGEHPQAAGLLPTPWVVVSRAAGLSRQRQRPIIPGRPPFKTDWLCGAIMLTRRALMEEMGGFDPRFFLYFEETDLCRRILGRGLELWAVGEAVAEHVGGDSAKAETRGMLNGCIAEQYFRSRFYYWTKHHGWAGAIFGEMGELAALALREAVGCLRGRRTGAFSARLSAPVFRFPEKQI